MGTLCLPSIIRMIHNILQTLRDRLPYTFCTDGLRLELSIIVPHISILQNLPGPALRQAVRHFRFSIHRDSLLSIF